MMKQVEPTVVRTEQDGDSYRLSLEIPGGLDFFKGHFTDAPILPGVVQLHWAVLFAGRCLGQKIEPKQVSNLKFKQLILPDTRVLLQLTHQAEKGQIRFSFLSALGENSSGVIRL